MENPVMFSLRKILGLWLSTTAVTFGLAWYLVPLVVDLVSIPAVLSYWLILMIGAAWQIGLVLWIIYRLEGSLSWETIRCFTRLSRPIDPKTDRAQARILWRGLRSWPLVFLLMGLGVLVPVILFLVKRFFPPGAIESPLLMWPAYTGLLELTSPEFTRQWWLIPLVILGWSTFALAEELLFHGLLLPRMSRVFGKRDCFVNALLFGLYSIFQYWMLPFRFLEGWILARLAKCYRSTWMAFVVRGVEGLAVGLLMTLGVLSQPLTASSRPIEFPSISARPAPVNWYPGKLADIPVYNPHSRALFKEDLLSADLSGLDLRGRINDLLYADFDLHTIWPDKNRMPVNFDPAQILEIGKDPGLGVRDLHAQGITGKGVGVAIIDQALLTEHIEYAERLRWYEELPGYPSFAEFHGSAVVSIAVGRTVGVAPEADLYYIGGAGSQISTFWALGHQYAQSIRRIIQINLELPVDRKIRVISISSGWLSNLSGYQDALRAVQEAEAAGMMVITTHEATGMPQGAYEGLGRPLTMDPDNLLSYEPGLWWANAFFAGEFQNAVERGSLLLFPMDARTMASPTGASDYVFNRSGGQSWVVPYIAGLYALAVQVDPAITPRQFWDAALQTGNRIEIQQDGKIYTLGKIIDPTELINIIKDSH